MDKPKEEKEECFLKEIFGEKYRFHLIFLAFLIAVGIVAIVITATAKCKCHTPNISPIDILAVLISFLSLYITTFLTLKVNRIAVENRKKDEEKAYDKDLQAQVASFPLFKINRSILYDMNDAFNVKASNELKTIEKEARKHCGANLKNYMIMICCQEAFPAYYKISIDGVRMILNDSPKSYVLPQGSWQGWTTNNQWFTIWINFEDGEQFTENLWRSVEREASIREKMLAIELDFSCTNTLDGKFKETASSIYRVHMDYMMQKDKRDEGVMLLLEHRYIERLERK